MADREYGKTGYLSEEHIDIHSFDSQELTLCTDDRRHVSFAPPREYHSLKFDMERLRSEDTDLKSPPAYDETLSLEIPADPQRLANSLSDTVGRLRIRRGSDTEISIYEQRYRDIDRSFEMASPKLGFSKTHDGETSQKVENMSSIYEEPSQRKFQNIPIYGTHGHAAYVPKGYTSNLPTTSITRREKEPQKIDGRSLREVLADFGYALRRLVRLAYPDGEYNTVLEQLVINQLLNGLSNIEMEKHVQFAHPLTLEAAVACAEEFEAFTGAQLNSPRKHKDDTPLSLPVNFINRNKQTKDKTENNGKILSQSPKNEIKDLTKS
ncbi:unnamed protein product [Mytilus coruscus]|uniref:Uncharacterized protein n=1 Tax=Mytilus coruscus TaxID=42192 RepID=A0A6J8B1A3_MYTCO|nr:unnamed protein product [Mytilus coruscus]